MTANSKFQFWIDRGGTFTDVVVCRPDGTLDALKLLSEDPAHYDDAALEGIRRAMGLETDAPIPAKLIQAVKMGTTVATNALLERKGAATVLVTTRGFADALAIGYQNRRNLFDLKIEKPELLASHIIEVDERVSADGTVLEPLDLEGARRGLAQARQDGFGSVAIALMHGYRFTAHEEALAALARELGFTQISASHEVSALIKFISRGDTAVVDAYLSPILKDYIARIDTNLVRQGTDCSLMFMRSNGGLTAANLLEGKDAVLSGPAGGVVGMVKTSQQAGFSRIIGFDMGGTSTDVSHYDGAYERTFQSEVAGVRLQTPMMKIHTVAAGGGSILTWDGARMRAGPLSAGADPGPASYGKGGPLTVTDANLMLGKLVPRFFPSVFGPHADAPLDGDLVRQKFSDLATQIAQTSPGMTSEVVAEGFIKIAVQNMAEAIKKISVARGYDVTRYVLTSFGGAGGQHACLVADALGMKKILLHPMAGVLSAYGMGLADIRATRELAMELPLSPQALDDSAAKFLAMESQTSAELALQHIAPQTILHHRRLHLRYKGSDTALDVAFDALRFAEAAFRKKHQARFGFAPTDKAIILEALELESVGPGSRIQESPHNATQTGQRPPPLVEAKTKVFMAGAWAQVPVFARTALLPGHTLQGPALVIEPHSTIVVEPGWELEVSALDHLVLTRRIAIKRSGAMGTHADPVMLEIFNNLFMSIAEQMGVTLEKTASSVNIKERLDFSCAVFDTAGALVANAPHMPVHLGSMGASVETIIEQNKADVKQGDVFVLNAPYNGGTHLPDITVVMPVFDGDSRQPLFWTAARGHHGDIGGLSPGSMPAHSTRVEEEGILIDNFKLVDGGRFCEQEMRDLLDGGRWPARNADNNIADLKAQVAACQKGAQELLKMVGDFGLDVVRAYMGHVQDNAEEAVRRVIDTLVPTRHTHTLDGDMTLHIDIRVDRKAREATFDFTGTSAQQPNNFNAPSAIARACVLYVLRCMVDDDIPLNAGCLKPVKIILPEGSLVAPRFPAAVVAGNVETSQAIVDALFYALGVVAGAQGTMNNLTFGNAQYQYYETICGGAGAGDGFDGADAIHTHMTNSRLTDPEILEWRFPVVLESFSIRKGSGGDGVFCGGNGTIRRIRFLEAMDLSILSINRLKGARGLAGGGDGAPGLNRIIRVDGSIETLKGSDGAHMKAGDVIEISTPGGGGYGKA